MRPGDGVPDHVAPMTPPTPPPVDESSARAMEPTHAGGFREHRPAIHRRV